ncbi:Asparaginase 2 domain containing protein [Asbolus verrucosus]|uniref:Asparaginase 2 domain containing protein n=1 Tax=Asbolus verrucosus TaxID=1661398 RepID=A0A482VK70_ASBVE|nr:Asparaginase 2 domain containing protein [Asbolus verrucosus]
MEPVILVHGGAGAISDDAKAQELLAGVKGAAKTGYKVLTSGGGVVDAVEAAVRSMEDEEIFNAGLGSVLNLEGEVEMDASIMVGSDLSAGAVTVVKDIKNPISLARLVMDKTDHVLLAAEGAKKFAQLHKVVPLQPGALVTDASKKALAKWREKQVEASAELGTVGAVGIDSDGGLAAATSTGGRQGKLAGRSSDTCMIGSGTYADDNIGAVSTTGHGETIAKFCLAHSIIKAMERGQSAEEATQNCVELMTKRLNNTAGAITLSNRGEVGVAFSTNRMSWAYQKGDHLYFGIDKNERHIEKV